MVACFSINQKQPGPDQAARRNPDRASRRGQILVLGWVADTMKKKQASLSEWGLNSSAQFSKECRRFS